jgi:hypothetical protein
MACHFVSDTEVTSYKFLRSVSDTETILCNVMHNVRTQHQNLQHQGGGVLVMLRRRW